MIRHVSEGVRPEFDDLLQTLSKLQQMFCGPCMDDVESLLRELRTDWEALLTEEFNPLKQALRNGSSPVEASEFRNIFHRVEKVMETIIERSYKGFSDSILSYAESYSTNKRCLFSISEILKISEELLAEKVEVSDMVMEHDHVEFLEIKYNLCSALVEIKKCFDEFCVLKEEIDGDMRRDIRHGDIEPKFFEATKRISKINELVKDHGLTRMKCIEELMREMSSEVSEFMKLVFRRLDLFIFCNEHEYQKEFNCVAVLNALEDLEKHQMENLEDEYYKVIEIAAREACKKVEGSRLEYLIKMLMGKARVVIRNFCILREMANAAFEGLQRKTKNFLGDEEDMFKIYGPSGNDVVEDALQRVLKKFISEYTGDFEDHLKEDVFLMEGFVDDVNYHSVFENKHPIHKKMVTNSKDTAATHTGFTKVCPPTIDAIVYMEKYAFSDRLRKSLRKTLSEKYVAKVEKVVEKKVADMLNDREGYKCDYFNKRLMFYSEYKRCTDEFFNYFKFCDEESSLSIFVSRLVQAKFSEFFNDTFKSPIIVECFRNELKTEEQHVDEFKRLFLVRAVDRSDLFLKRCRYEHVLFAMETLKDINALLNCRSIEEMTSRMSIGLKLQISLDVLYFFDLFYREGNYTCESDYYLCRITKAVEEFHYAWLPLGACTEYLSVVFDCLNFYAQNNIGKLNVRSSSDLKAFVNKLELLNEVLSMIDFEDSMKDLIDFLTSTISGCARNEHMEVLLKKIGMC